MKANLEWTSGVIRAGREFEKYGDPYEFACTVLRIGDTAYIFGAAGEFSRKTYEAIREELKSHGIAHVEWSRLQQGRTKKVSDDV